MKFEPSPLAKYAIEHSTSLSEILSQLDRETHLTKLLPQMICGELVGGFLRMISNWQKPSSVLELGTFTGYSTICLAEGLAEGGSVTTIEINPEHEKIQKKYFELSGHSSKINALIGDAKELVAGMNKQFDMVFIDADKENYPTYFELIKPMMNPNSIMIVDNVLWDGKVIVESENDKETKGIRIFNDMVQRDPEVENLLLPFNDGLMLVRKVV